MPPAAQSHLYTTQADVEALLSAEGVTGWLDDNFGGTVSAAELAYLTTQGVNYGTMKVNLYCGALYAPSQLANSWAANYWATGLAACWLTRRRGNAVPDSLKALCEEIHQELQAVKDGELVVPDAAQRAPAWPAWSNVRVDPRFRVKQLRVQRPLSEPSPTPYPQRVDWPAEYSGEA